MFATETQRHGERPFDKESSVTPGLCGRKRCWKFQRVLSIFQTLVVHSTRVIISFTERRSVKNCDGETPVKSLNSLIKCD